jgi:hypothetical protein
VLAVALSPPEWEPVRAQALGSRSLRESMERRWVQVAVPELPEGAAAQQQQAGVGWPGNAGRATAPAQEESTRPLEAAVEPQPLPVAEGEEAAAQPRPVAEGEEAAAQLRSVAEGAEAAAQPRPAAEGAEAAAQLRPVAEVAEGEARPPLEGLAAATGQPGRMAQAPVQEEELESRRVGSPGEREVGVRQACLESAANPGAARNRCSRTQARPSHSKRAARSPACRRWRRTEHPSICSDPA